MRVTRLALQMYHRCPLCERELRRKPGKLLRSIGHQDTQMETTLYTDSTFCYQHWYDWPTLLSLLLLPDKRPVVPDLEVKFNSRYVWVGKSILSVVSGISGVLEQTPEERTLWQEL